MQDLNHSNFTTSVPNKKLRIPQHVFLDPMESHGIPGDRDVNSYQSAKAQMCSNILGLPHFPQPLQMEERTMLQAATTVITASDPFSSTWRNPRNWMRSMHPNPQIFPLWKIFAIAKRGRQSLRKRKNMAHLWLSSWLMPSALWTRAPLAPRSQGSLSQVEAMRGNSGMSNYVRMISTCLLKECSHLGWFSSKLAGLAARVTKIIEETRHL